MNSLIGYDPAGAWEHFSDTVEDLLGYRNSAGLNWINIDAIDPGTVNLLASMYRIHPLTVEDILDTNQRPKTEEFDEYFFIVLKAIHRENEKFDYEQISIVLMEDTVITFQQKPGDIFGGIRKRILNNAGKLRRVSTDYLAYVLMDAVVDDYFTALDSVSDQIEAMEDRASEDTGETFMADLQTIKLTLLHLRRYIWPLRESLTKMLHSDSPLIHGDLSPFLHDLHENVIQAAETVDTHRELLTGLMEMNLSAISNRTNRIMKVLTIISTIFIPLTFIVGVYGMNFTNMPELSSAYGYPATWAVMILTATGMLIFFKRRRWI
ncbi:MAG: magnesium/cobalt transporter CorA [Spirochaetaceae bacterium]|jgi:magnesium transporter|nr:magnesium/cobalt transporter CorA [Spirochaetaceae bacterium]